MLNYERRTHYEQLLHLTNWINELQKEADENKRLHKVLMEHLGLEHVKERTTIRKKED